MKKLTVYALVLGQSFLLTSCDLVEGIFKAGMIWGIILVVLVVALIFWLIRKARD